MQVVFTDIQNITIKYLKNLKIFLWKKRRFRLRWDSSSGLSIAQRSRKRLFSTERFFKFFKYLNSIALFAI